MLRRFCRALPALLLLLVLVLLWAAVPAGAESDWDVVAREIGRAGELHAGVYRVGFPRADLKVSVEGIPVRTGLAFGGWAAFARENGSTVVDGDLVLLPGEIDRVASALQAHGFEITALHNHLVGETPRVMYLHFFGSGDAGALARGLRAAVAETATPPPPAPAPVVSPAPAWAEVVQRSFGHSGTVRGGVLSIGVPRPEAIHAHGATLAPTMGMAHSFNFQETENGRVATTGDFVLTADEVNPVLRALRGRGIGVTAIHNHLLHGTPALVFMHFWAVGEPVQIGEALRQALAQARTRQG